MLAQKGAALEKGTLAGSEVFQVLTILVAWPTTPAGEGEAGGKSLLSHAQPAQYAIYPMRGGGRGRRVEEASGNVDRPGCWGPAVLGHPPPSWGQGGAGCTGGARVQSSLREDRSTLCGG
jgi:hypothetical protein